MSRQAPDANEGPVVDLELCWGTLGLSSVCQQAEVAAAAGFRYMTISPRQHRVSREQLGEGMTTITDTLRRTGVRISVLDALLGCLPGSPVPEDLEEQYRSMVQFSVDDCFRILDEIGGETLQVAHFLGAPVPVSQMIDAIGSLAERARRHGYRLSLEFMPRTGIPDLPTAVTIVEAVRMDEVGVMLDTYHLARTGGSAVDIDRRSAATVNGLQVNDGPMAPSTMAGMPYTPMSDRLVPGEGAFKLVDILRAVLDERPELRVGIEVFSHRLRAMPPAEAAGLVRDATLRVLSRVGDGRSGTEPGP